MLALVAWHCRKAGSKGGHLPMLLETVLRVCFLQKKNVRREPIAEETRFNREAMRRYAGIKLGEDRILFLDDGIVRGHSLEMGQGGS